MKIHSTPQSLSLVLQYLQQVVMPDLTSKDAVASARIIQSILEDLLKRHGPSADLLLSISADSESLEKAMAHTLGRPASQQNGIKPIPAESFDVLADRYEHLVDWVVKLCIDLSSSDNPNAPALLRRAAEWEYSYYEILPTVENKSYYDNVQTSKTQAPILSKEYLERFLQEKRGPLQVCHLQRLTGEHGKQTYIATVKLGNGKTEVVIRKEDEAPIMMRGIFMLVQDIPLDAFSEFFEFAGESVAKVRQCTIESRYRRNLEHWEQYISDVGRLPSSSRWRAPFDIVAYLEIDSCSNRGGSVTMELVTGEKFEIQCTPVAKSFVCWHRGIASTDRICEFRAVGEKKEFKGVVDFESSCNVHQGSRKPRTLMGGIIDDGFTPS
ncbi:kinase-like protein [Zalerion maritima]|uniref:Kinase-like protein n=1 Tax=Zalerion maritima TaxID=339359 RepID=A0AAD5RJ07_9PEZI|nr:kinase-like protein [Zalerion maritima]